MKNNTNDSVNFCSVYSNAHRDLLKPDKYKDIIVKRLFSFVEDNGIVLNAFVIMPSHFYMIWQALGYDCSDVLLNNLLKKITRDIVYDLEKNHPVVLPIHNRYSQQIENHLWHYQLSAFVFNDEQAYQQKLDYIHNTPVRKGLCVKAEEYKYSSARLSICKKDYN